MQSSVKFLITVLSITLMLGLPLRLGATALSHAMDTAAVSQAADHDTNTHKLPANCHEESADKGCPCGDDCNGACQHCYNISVSLLPALAPNSEIPQSQPRSDMVAPQIVPHPERLIRPPIALHS